MKHAAARQVRVDIRQHEGGVRLRVKDDGKGFDPATVPDGHLGLAGMRARTERVGGTFTCVSEPGSGTAIEVTLAPAALADLRGGGIGRGRRGPPRPTRWYPVDPRRMT